MERSGGGSELRFQRWCLLGLPINPGALPQADDECCAFGQTSMDSAEFNPPRWWSRHKSLPSTGALALEDCLNFSSDFTKFPGNGRTRSKMRGASGWAVA